MKDDSLPVYSPSLTEILDQSPLKLPVDTPLIDVLTRMNSVEGSQCQLDVAEAEIGLSQQGKRSYSYVLAMAGDQLVGIFTERDLVRKVALGESCSHLRLADMITPQPITLKPSEYKDIFSILSRLRQHRIRHLPVVNEAGQLLGMITPETLRWILEPASMLRLSQVSEVMNRTVIQIHAEASVLEAAQLMAQDRVSCVVVVEAQKHSQGENVPVPIGMITERDILQYQVLALDLTRLRVAELMSTPLWSIRPNESSWQAHQQMLQKRVRRLVVVGEAGELQGLLTQTNLFNSLNPVELYGLVDVLQQKITDLEAEKQDLLKQQNQQLEQQVQQRTILLQQQAKCDRLKTTIAEKIRRSLNLEDTLNTTVTEIHQLLQTDRVVIYRFNPDWSGVVVAESVGSQWQPLLGKVIHDPCFAPDWVQPYSSGRIRAVSDIYQIEIAPCHLELLEQLQIRAKLLVPIVITPTTERVQNPENRLWGLLCANQCVQVRQWHEFEIELLEKLAIQVAIAIQQSELYQQSQAELVERQRMQETLQNLAISVSPTATENIFSTLVRHLAPAIDADSVVIGTLINPQKDRLKTVAYYHQGQIVENCEYDLNETPCQQVIEQQGLVMIPQQVQQQFSQLHHPIESYLGIPLFNSKGEIFGLVCASSKSPQVDTPFKREIVQLFAIRVAAELERNWATDELKQLNQELEHRVEERTILLKTTNQQLREEVLERQQAEEQLRQSLKALSDIKYALDQSDIIAFTDAQGVITEVNDKFCQISQYNRADLIGNTHRLVNSGYHSPEFFKQMWRTIRQGEIWRGEIKNQAKDGSFYWVNTVIVPFLNAENKPIQYLAIRTDITNRKNAEEELKRQNLKSRLFTEITLNIRQSLELTEILQTTVNEIQNILQTQRVLIYRVFPDGRGSVITEQVKTGWDSILNQDFSQEVFPAEYQQQYQNGKAKAIHNVEQAYGDITPCLIEFLASLKVKAKLIVPILQDQNLWGFMIVHQCDYPRQWKVFEMELMEQIAVQVGIALSQAELLEREKELGELKSRFISMASHEFRTPLSLISSSAGILQDYRDRLTPEKQQKHIHRIFSAVDHITHILDDVLTINRTESQQFELKLSRLELVSFCSNLVKVYQRKTQQHQIILIAIDRSTGTKLSNFTALFDEALLHKIIVNLLSNAIKYSPQGGRIEFQLIHHHQTIIFKVCDRGLGIPLEDQPRIFESFHRAKNVGTIPGTGLGLAIVKRCVDLHQGTIEMNSELGKGTRFQVKFKLDE